MTQTHAKQEKFFTLDFVLVCLSALVAFTISHLLLPVLPLYVLHLGGSEAEIGWTIALFNISTVLTRLWAGKWSETFGPARVMRFASVLLLFAVSIYNLAGTILVLMFTRIVHGLGHGAYLTSAGSVVAYMAPASRRGHALGIYLMSTNISMALGPFIGLSLAMSLGYTNLFLAILAVLLFLFAATQLVDRNNKYVSPERNEGKVFNADAWLPALVGTTVYFTFGALASYLAPYAMQKGLDNPDLFFTAYALCSLLVRAFGGALSDRAGRFKVIVPSALTMCLSMAWLTLASDGWSIIVAGALYGIGSGVLFPVLMAYSVDMVHPTERSSAVATFLASTDLGQALGAFVSGIVVYHFLLQAVWIVAGTSAFLGLGVFLILGRSRQPKSTVIARSR